MSSSRNCKLPADTFCYVCGHYIGSKQVKHKIVLGTKFCEAYRAYFGVHVQDQHVTWAPHVTCGSCRSTLEGWLRGTRKCMPFAIPRIWREPTNHHDNCYFCMVDITHYKSTKNRKNIPYPSIPSSIAPVPHSEELPIPSPPKQSSEEEVKTSSEDSENSFSHESLEPQLFTQQKLDDLVRELQLTKSKAELLASRLKEYNLLDKSCKITKYRVRHEDFACFYQMDENLCFCNDVNGLFEHIKIPHEPDQWRLFIDSSSRSLKAVLLHNGNKFPSIPVAHSAQLKETYENIKLLLEKLKYECYKWDVCGDFKMLGFLLGLQGGYTKYSCFLCLWDSRADDQHYTRKEWPTRKELVPGAHNVRNEPLVSREKILLPPLHIKLGLVKQFIKGLDSNSEALNLIRQMFPKISEAKIKGGIFTGPQIRVMLKSKELVDAMTLDERNAWDAFRMVVQQFLGNNRSENYMQLIENLIQSYHVLGCRMSVKMHYLFSHIDFFRPNLGAVSEEHGERFHQDIHCMERRYQGRWDCAMMGDYVWGIVRAEGSEKHKRKSRSDVHF